MSIDNPQSNQLPGPSEHEDYNIGDEYEQASSESGSQVGGLPPLLGQLPGLDNDANMGALSGEVGLQQDNDSVFNGGVPFVDPSSKPVDTMGMNSMEGLVDDRHVEILRDAEMYSSQQAPLPFPVIEETANPLIPFDASETDE